MAGRRGNVFLDSPFQRTLGDLWLLIPGPAKRGTLHDETGVKYDCSAQGMAMKPTQNVSTNCYMTKGTRFKEGLSGMTPNRHLLQDRCYVKLQVPQTGRTTDGTRS